MPPRLARAALAGALCLACPALGQERPPPFPTRDALVEYRVEGEPAGLRAAFLAAERLVRLDLPGEQGWLVTDARGAGFLVLPRQRMLLDLAPGQDAAARALLPPASGRWTREGEDRVAGTACTLWRVEDRGGRARLCLTAEGLPLRVEPIGGPGRRLEATALTLAPQDPARFRRPEGLAAFEMPRGTPGPAQGLPRGTALPPPGLALPPG